LVLQFFGFYELPASSPPAAASVALGVVAGRHVGVDQDANGFVPGRDLFVRGHIAALLVVMLVAEVKIDIRLVAGGRGDFGRARGPRTLLVASLRSMSARFAGGAPSGSVAIPPRSPAALAFAFPRTLTARRIPLVLVASPWPATVAASRLTFSAHVRLRFQLFLALEVEIDVLAGRFNVLISRSAGPSGLVFANAAPSAAAAPAPPPPAAALLGVFVASGPLGMLAEG
jgi:hypothetical protein